MCTWRCRPQPWTRSATCGAPSRVGPLRTQAEAKGGGTTCSTTRRWQQGVSRQAAGGPARRPDAARLPARAIWVVDCRAWATASKALVYLGRYLYRGVIRERDIVRCDATARSRSGIATAKTGKKTMRTLSGADFLWLVLQHVLAQGLAALAQLWFAASQQRRCHPAAAGAAPARCAVQRCCTNAAAARCWRCVCGQPMLVVCRRMPALQGDVVAQRKPSRVIRPDNPHSSRASTMH